MVSNSVNLIRLLIIIMNSCQHFHCNCVADREMTRQMSGFKHAAVVNEPRGRGSPQLFNKRHSHVF